MSDYDIRPHHALCIGFFEGKGYSEKFTENMEKICRTFSENDSLIKFTDECDIICGSCPNNAGGSCTSEEKVKKYDTNVLKAIGAEYGDEITYSDVSQKIRKYILNKNILSDICGDCFWHKICRDKERMLRRQNKNPGN